MQAAPQIRLEPWGPGDYPLLAQLMGDPAMTVFLGGPETPAKLAERQQRYEAAGSGMYKIVDIATGRGAGSVGFWDRSWRDQEIYEVGWSVIPEFQRRGIARAATAEVIALARATHRHRYMHAFPKVANDASNAVCRKLGFELLGEVELEYPVGTPIICNDWRLDLTSV